MKKQWLKLFTFILLLSGIGILAQPALAVGGGSGSISLTTIGSAYTQDFDTLANTGTTNALTINGWFLDETGTSTVNNGQYAGGTGSNTAGDTYSFGDIASGERAFGQLFSGTLTPIIGASFTNNTGETVTALDVSYTGEMWRAGVTNRNAADRLDFQFSTDATSVTTGTWVNYDSLDFNSPNISATAGALIGNSATNQTALSFSISSLSIPNGATFWIRWTDFNISGSDDGLAVDSFSITPLITDSAPTVTGTTPSDGATGVAPNVTVSVTFNEMVTLSGTVNIDCTISPDQNVTTSTASPNTTFVLPHTIFLDGDVCTVTILNTQVSDQDANDPPENMTANSIFSFTVEDVCAHTYTPIYNIQGSGPAAAITGLVTTEGVVVGDFETTASGLGGFYVQDATGDGDPATSDGVFVYTGTTDLVNYGQLVRVTGYARERFSQTRLNGADANNDTAIPAANIVVCGTSSVSTVDVTMPFTTMTDPERYEGMLVRFPQSLVIAEYFNFDQFGEIVLALPLDGEPRPFTGTAIDEPGPAANARTTANLLRRITLDDAWSGSNPTVLRHPNGDPFALNNLFRGGDLVQNAIGVLGYDFNLYRIIPTGPADYTATNPRPTAPEDVGGLLTVAGMNTLNFFLTPDYPTGDPLDNKCGPSQNVECRGHDSNQPSEFSRQRDKLLAALASLDADIIGLNEIENTPGVSPLGDPTNGIVAGLNNLLGAGTYAYIDTLVIGTDAIRVGLIYKPASVTPVGAFQILDSTDDPRFLDNRNRPALAQTFEEVGTGAKFTVAVNHLKSKGCGSGADAATGPDADQGDGQSCWNPVRRDAAMALVDWLATDPTNSGDPDFLIIGDLNSYTMEDPIDAVKRGSDDTATTADDYVNLIAQFQGPFAYSYTFDGQAGYLDYAMAINSLAAQVTGAADWHINSDESDVVDYDTTFKPPAQDALFESNAYRSSDHDPVLVGINLGVPLCSAAEPSRATLAPPNHNFVTIDINGVTDPEDEAITISITSIFQDEPVNGDNDGDTWPDGAGIGMSAAQVRAERDGLANGRVYHISFLATDPHGNSCTGTVQVGVPISKGYGPAVDDGALHDSTVYP